MKHSSLFAIVLLALLAGLIVVPPAAAEPRSGPALSGLAGTLERFWGFLSVFQAKNGCEIDPNGVRRCQPAPAAPARNGCIIDPDGVPRCEPAPVATPKNGCIIDPSGIPRCEPAAATVPPENGCRIDPDGACRR
jgi:hypothetical protein